MEKLNISVVLPIESSKHKNFDLLIQILYYINQ
jgi:hypothetical protein